MGIETLQWQVFPCQRTHNIRGKYFPCPLLTNCTRGSSYVRLPNQTVPARQYQKGLANARDARSIQRGRAIQQMPAQYKEGEPYNRCPLNTKRASHMSALQYKMDEFIRPGPLLTTHNSNTQRCNTPRRVKVPSLQAPKCRGQRPKATTLVFEP